VRHPGIIFRKPVHVLGKQPAPGFRIGRIQGSQVYKTETLL